MGGFDMKKRTNIIYVILILSICFLGTSCNNQSSEVSYVTLTFLQHKNGLNNHTDDGTTYAKFSPEIVCRSYLKYEKGHYLTSEEISSFTSPTSGVEYTFYYIPIINHCPDEGACYGGYFVDTGFFIDYDEETYYSYTLLRPMVLNDNLTLHFSWY
jgi:hypothetical protein